MSSYIDSAEFFQEAKQFFENLIEINKPYSVVLLICTTQEGSK